MALTRFQIFCEVGYIYKIQSPSGKIYIGQTKDFEHRMSLYKGAHCKNQIKLYRSIQKYGWSAHTAEIIETTATLEELDAREIHWIAFYNSLNGGLNCTLGGSTTRGRVVSEETKQKQREKMTGRKASDATKKKMSESAKALDKKTNNLTGIKRPGVGKKVWESRKQSGNLSNGCEVIILDTQTGIYYESMTEAAEVINVTIHTLYARLNGKCKNKTSLIIA